MSASPHRVTGLKADEIFVFGSNDAGHHGKGAAVWAKRFGAKRGVGRGRTGRCYAIATKDEDLRVLPLREIATQIEDFLDYAEVHPELTFLVTPVGCGLAGYEPRQVGPYFLARRIDNVWLPQCFLEQNPV